MPMSVPTTGGTGDFKADGTVALTGQVTTNVGTFASAVANGATAVGFKFNTPAYSTAGAKLLSVQNNAVEKSYIDKDGLLVSDLCPAGMASPGAWAKIYAGGNNGMVFRTYNRDMLYLSGQTRLVQTANDGFFAFSGTSGTVAAADVAIGRVAPSVLGVLKSATASDWGDLKFRNSIATGNTALGIVAKTANYTVTANDGVIECDATTGAITLTLPAVATATAGTTYTLKKTDASANAVIFDGNAAETIDGAATVQTTTQYASLTIIRNAAGTAWLTLKD